MNDLTALLIAHGPAAMASALASLMIHAIQIEREQVLQAESQQRTAERQGYANGFKPKPLKTRVGQIALRIPQTRDDRDENGRPFYPKSLERGVHDLAWRPSRGCECRFQSYPPSIAIRSAVHAIATDATLSDSVSRRACEGSRIHASWSAASSTSLKKRTR